MNKTTTDPRDTVHRRGLNAWAKNKFNGTLLYGTGSGKTYCGLRAIDYLFNEYGKNLKVLVVCPRHVIIENWLLEIKKSKRSHLKNHIEFICYQSLTKYNKSKYDLIILDEVHHVTSEKRMLFLKENPTIRILGLTASLTLPQKILLKRIPVVDTYNIKQANADAVISNYRIYTISLSFTAEERALYNKYTKQIDNYYTRTGKQLWKVIGLRSNLIYSAHNKLELAVSLQSLFKDKYGVLFTMGISESQWLAENIENCVELHSGMTKKQQRLALHKYIDGRTNVNTIATPTMLDEGVTLPRLSYGIIVSSNSTEKQTVQRVGRVVRLDSAIINKEAIIIRIYIKNSVEEKWVKDSLKTFNVIPVNTYEEFKKIITSRNRLS